MANWTGDNYVVVSAELNRVQHGYVATIYNWIRVEETLHSARQRTKPFTNEWSLEVRRQAHRHSMSLTRPA